MIIGVALVVDELHKGQRLACRYPESNPSSVMNTDEGLLKFHQDNLSISPENFAKLFRPKPALFNQVVELTIDDISYLSFACPCAEELSSEGNVAGDIITMFNVVIATVRDSSLRRVLGINYQASTDALGRPATYTGVEDLRRVGCDPMTAAMGLREGIHLVHNDMLRKVLESFSKALLHQEKRYKYVSKQVAIMLKLHDSIIDRSAKLPSKALPGSSIEAPGIMTDEKDSREAPGGMNDNESSNPIKPDEEPILNDAVIASSVDNQMVLESFLLVMELMLHKSSLANEIRNLYHGLVGGHSINLTVNGALSISIQLQDFGLPAPPTLEPPSRNFSSSCLMIAGNDSNRDSVDSIAKIKVDSTEAQIRNIENLRTQLTELKPFQTILLAADAEVLSMLMVGSLDPSNYSNILPHWSLRNAPTNAGGVSTIFDFSNEFSQMNKTGTASTDTYQLSSHQQFIHPTIMSYIQHAQPTVSFIELSIAMNIPLSEVYMLAQHFCSWGLGRVMNTITMNSVFKVHPQAPTGVDSRAAGVFAATFPCAGFVAELKPPSLQASAKSGIDNVVGPDSNAALLLHRVLQVFDGERKLSVLIALFPVDLQPLGVEIVVWLIRWRMIVEVNTYLLNVARATTIDDGHGTESTTFQNHSFVRTRKSRAGLSKEEIKKRICPYMDGKTDLFEMCWKENLDETDILEAVDDDEMIISLVCTNS